MKKFLFIFMLASGFAFSQMPNIAEVWMNKSQPYTGTIAGKELLKIKINISEQNRKNDQEYFLAGYSMVEKNFSKFEGKLKINQYRDGKKRSTVYGEYELAEEPKGKHSGIFTGKFIYTFMWNAKLQQVEKQFIEFIGNWKSYDGTLSYKTTWKNQ
ncbi:MAG: hypothetical protein I8H68_10130 [Flavobacteriia bacterium]|nr:hypothetical protein [Flavobacteriia bacterium]